MDEELIKLRENRGIKRRFGRFQQARQLDNLLTPILEISLNVVICLAIFFSQWRSDESPAVMLGVVDEYESFNISVVCIVLVVILTGVSIWYIGGKQYRWETNDEALVIRRGSEERYYYYSEVYDVIFEKFGLGGLRGWEVTIKTEYREDTWRLVIGTQRIYSALEETPFYILMQNSGLAELDGVTLESEPIDDAFRNM